MFHYLKDCDNCLSWVSDSHDWWCLWLVEYIRLINIDLSTSSFVDCYEVSLSSSWSGGYLIIGKLSRGSSNSKQPCTRWCRCYIAFNRESVGCGVKIHWSWVKCYTMSILHAYLIGLRILIIQSTARCNWCLLSRFADSWVFNWSVVKIQGNIVPIYDSGVLSSWSIVEWSDSTTWASTWLQSVSNWRYCSAIFKVLLHDF